MPSAKVCRALEKCLGSDCEELGGILAAVRIEQSGLATIDGALEFLVGHLEGGASGRIAAGPCMLEEMSDLVYDDVVAVFAPFGLFDIAPGQHDTIRLDRLT